MFHKAHHPVFPALLAFLLLYAPHEAAALYGSGTVIVNADSFLAIDETVSGADLSFEFGKRIYKTLTYERASARFRFNDTLSMSGSLIVAGRISLSGSTLTVNGAGSGKVSLQGRNGGKICILDTDSIGYTVLSGNDGALTGRASAGGECP